jgi:hypothetical protein
MASRICLSVLLAVWVAGPLAAQRRSDSWEASIAMGATSAWSARMDQDRLTLQAARNGDAGPPRLGPAAGMVLGAAAGATLGVGISRATCEPERCEGMAHVAAFFLGGLTGAALGYLIAGGKNLPGTRPAASPPVRRSR